MADVETLQYNIDSKAQLQAMQDAIDTFEEMGEEYQKLADELADVSERADRAEKELKELTSTGGKLKRAFSGLGGLISGGLGALAGLVSGAITSTREWALGVEDLSNKFAIGLDDATALATSWRLAGVEASEGEAAILSFQGRLIDEIEAQKEAAKEVQAIQRERVDVLADLAEAETDHLQTLADLEAERAEISAGGVGERRAQQKEELASLRKDYDRFLADQRAAEERETENFEEIWEERTRIFEQKSEQLRFDLSEKGRAARNVREFQAAKDEFRDKQALLNEELNSEKGEREEALEDRIGSLQAAAEREEELLAERTQAVNKSADADVAKIEASNAKALASLEKRIAGEKEAFAGRTEDFNEDLASLSEAEAAAQEAGAGLKFVMEELGIQMTDAEGNIRPVDELMWDMKEALNAMEDGAKKAAIISDLGWEELATWIEDGADATEALTFAQENNLTVTEDHLAAIKEQNRLLAEMQLKLLGVAGEFANSETVSNAMTNSLIWLSERMSILIDVGRQAAQIINTLWEKGNEEGWFEGLIAGFETVMGWIDQAFDIGGMLAQILGTEGGAAALGQNLLGVLPGFQTGTRSVPGTGAQLAVVHGGEDIRTRGQVLADRSGGGRRDVNVNIAGNVFGVGDIQAAVKGAIREYDMGRATAGGAA